jgi:hypothetical protein
MLILWDNYKIKMWYIALVIKYSICGELFIEIKYLMYILSLIY